MDTEGDEVGPDLIAAAGMWSRPGRYWLPGHTNPTFASPWAWYASIAHGDGAFAGLGTAADGSGQRAANSGPGHSPGLAASSGARVAARRSSMVSRWAM